MKVSSLHLIFHSILFSVTQQAPASEHHNLSNIGLNIFVLLAICLQAKKQRDPVIPSGDKCDQRILKSTWLKAFAAISQDQEFPQIWDFYGELDSNISFYMTTFPAKINHKTFQNKRRTLFWVNFVHILSFLPKGNFS